MNYLNLTIILTFVGQSVQDCWWTGCQLNSWAVKGCASYNRQERGKQACYAKGGSGNKYHCCTGGGGGKPVKPHPKPKPNPGRGGGKFVSFDQFKNAVTSNRYPTPSQEQYNNFNKYARTLGKISDVQEAAMALAQLLHESDGLRAKREYACARSNCPSSYRSPGCDMPGRFYYGRGYIQLTWCGNYRAASEAIFGDNRLVMDPDVVAKRDDIAWQTAFWYWGTRVHNQPGVQQGRFGATTKAINGALECSAPGNQKAQARVRIYQNVRRAFGLSGHGDTSGCP